MFVLDQQNNKLKKISSSTFHELGYKEREHLQEWIAHNPECLGEELLIIQKEFDGFNDTNERLDLLALDKAGTVVVIENKLDDTGKDVVWQTLKYVSYCSTLTKIQIKEIYQQYLDKTNSKINAEEKISEFFDGKPFSELTLNEADQRMIMVAGQFRKEVTSTVMWMLNHGIKAQCFKATPYKYNDAVLLDIEQIIPVKEAEDYIIKMADKTRQEKEAKETNKDIMELRKRFWTELLEEYNKSSSQFKNVNPSTDHWLSSGSGVSGATFNFLFTSNYAGIELMINIGSQEMNKKLFDQLFEKKDSITSTFGNEITWERLDEKKSCRIAYKKYDLDIRNKDDWQEAKEFLCNAMPRFDKALRELLKKAATSK